MTQTVDYPKTILISEHTNTYGCWWTLDESGAEINYGFMDLPPKQSLWLDCASGDAVDQLIKIDGLVELVGTTPGAYGGKCRTVRVDVEQLEAVCRDYWNRVNAAGERADARRDTCHYCGNGSVVGFNIFNAPHCEQCG